jgi:hypothetical protein
MILRELQGYLCAQRQTSLAELERQFQIDADALRGMLEQLMRRGRVRKLAGRQCGSCHSCAPTSLELYQWVHPVVHDRDRETGNR